jgi:protein phosphatase
MTRLAAGLASDTGRVRSNNEDMSHLGDDLFVVADGMGGHRGGEVASRLAVNAVRDGFADHTLEGLVDAVVRANDSVYQRAADDPDLHGMGTTLVAIAMVEAVPSVSDVGEAEEAAEADAGDELAWVNVGDSRLYVLRNGDLEQLSEDHSLVEEMVRDGQLTPDEAASHPRRHIVTRALGIDPFVRVDAATIVPYAGDRYVLCSDGLYEEVDDSKIAATLRKLADPTEAARELVRLAVEAGGRDNVTVIVVDVIDDGGRASRASSAISAEPGHRDLAGFTTAAPPDEAPLERAVEKAEPAPKARKEKTAHGRRLTWRVAVFALGFLAVLALAAGAIGWYARHTYFVSFQGDEVAVFRGRPGGFLWFDPTLEETTGIARAEVPTARVAELENGVEEGTVSAALEYVRNLEEQISVDTTSTSTTTTVSGGSPTVPPTTPTST